MRTSLVLITDHGLVLPRELVSPWPLVGVICSMAWELTGDRLRIVWFHDTQKLRDDLKQQIPMTTRPVKSYTQTKGQIAEKMRRRRARRKVQTDACATP